MNNLSVKQLTIASIICACSLLAGCNSSDGNITAPPTNSSNINQGNDNMNQNNDSNDDNSDSNPSELLSADTIIINAKIYGHNTANALAVEDGKITFIGDNQMIQALAKDYTTVIDANNQLVLPGFIDNHNHLGEGGEVTCLPSTERSLAAQRNLLRRCARDAQAGQWIIGYGSAFELEIEQTTTPRELLDQIFPNNPVIIMDFTSHAQFVNSAAYQLAGFDQQSPNPQGGILLKDEYGELNGIVLDNAGDIIYEIATNSINGKFDFMLEGIQYGLEQAKQNGITTVGDGRTYWRRGMYDAWVEMAQQQRLTARISVRPWIYPDVDRQEQLNFLHSAFQNDIEQLLIVNQVKMYSDGMPEYSTGRVIEPYTFSWFAGYPHGINYIDQHNMTEWLQTLQTIGYGAHIHAIGDLGVRESLNAIEAARNNQSQLKYHITHLHMMDPQDLPRFAALNVDADLQLAAPSFSESERAEHITDFIGTKRASEIYHTPVKQLQQSGANVVLSSDWTVNPIAPTHAIANAIEEGSLNINQAINAYTINAANALGLAEITGSLTVGKSADMVILNTDLTTATPSQIRAAQVNFTLLQGQVVYQR